MGKKGSSLLMPPMSRAISKWYTWLLTKCLHGVPDSVNQMTALFGNALFCIIHHSG